MAMCYLRKGFVLQAVEAYSAALVLDPGLTGVRCSLGDLWLAQGEAGRAPATECYTAALGTDPRCAPAWHGLGNCARRAGDDQRALACYAEAARLTPGMAEAHAAAGALLRDLGRKAEAEAEFACAARLRPNCALTMGNLAGAYYDRGNYNEAIAAYRRALSLNPCLPEALNNLGNALREVGRLEEAASCYTGCIQLQLATATSLQAAAQPPPARAAAAATAAASLAVCYSNLGGCFKLQGRAAECITAYEHVLKLQPRAAEAYANVGSAYKDAGRQNEALVAYARALALRPDFPEAFANLVHSMQCVCDWRDRDSLFARLEGEVRRDLATPGRLPAVQPFHAMAYPFPAELALAISRRYAQHCLDAARLLPGAPAEALPHPPARALRPGERLRVAYVSSDFGNHPLSHLMSGVFGMHDRRCAMWTAALVWFISQLGHHLVHLYRTCTAPRPSPCSPDGAALRTGFFV
jgi:protein O-GlcNAc transferase